MFVYYNTFMGIFQHLGHLVFSVGLLVSSFFAHGRAIHDQNYHIAQPTITPTASQQNSQQVASSSASASPSASFYTAARSISSQGHTIYISVNIPKDGGNVTGKITGDCTGDVTGHYDGKDEGTISGSAKVGCKYFFMRLPGTATFDGTVNKSDSTAELYTTLNFNGTDITQNVYVNLE